MTLGFFSGTLTPSQWHDGVALLQRRSGIILPSFTVGAFIVLSFICGKTILKTQDNINLVNNRMIDIHKILRQDKKYWYDKDSQMFYLREIEKNK